MAKGVYHEPGVKKPWNVRYFDPLTGKHRKILFRTRREARKALRMPVSCFVEKFFLPIKYELAKNRRDFQNTRSIVRKHVLPHLGKTPIAKVSIDDIAGLLEGMKTEKDYSAQTCAHVFSVLYQVFDLATALKKADSNPLWNWNYCISEGRMYQPTFWGTPDKLREIMLRL